MIAEYAPCELTFRFQARTSRRVMATKSTFMIRLTDEATGAAGVGECALFRGLSADDTPDYEAHLAAMCAALNRGENVDPSRRSSMVFGLETALLSLEGAASAGRNDILLPGAFTEGAAGIPINGLVWMDSVETMFDNAVAKAEAGFGCVKIKIGQHDFEQEIRMLDRLRLRFGPDRLMLRLDANGAYAPDDAVAKLKRLAVLDIHSVEQPVAAGHWDRMAYVCENSPIAIALDEELIGAGRDASEMRKMLGYIAPRFIILKPSLCGGFAAAQQWIAEAERLGIGWWVTSALESNVGLNAIAQWTAAMQAEGCQGLGTGSLYTDNFPSPLSVRGEALHFDPSLSLDTSSLQWIRPE